MIKVQVRSIDGQVVEEHTFEADEVTIGRVKGNEIVLPVPGVSKRHARLSVRDGRLHVVDLKSTNGTIVRGQKITTPVPVQNHEEIRVGDFHVRAVWEPTAVAPAPAASADDGIQTMAGAARPAAPARDLPGGPVIPMVGGAPPPRPAAPANVTAPGAGPGPATPRSSSTSPSSRPATSSVGPPPIPAATGVKAPSIGAAPSPGPAANPTITRDQTIRRSRPSATSDGVAIVPGTRPLAARPVGRTTIPILRDARPDIGTPSDATLAARATVLPAVLRSHAEMLETASWPVSASRRASVQAALERTVERDATCAKLDDAARSELLTVLVDDVVGLGPLEHWLDDESIDAITVLGADEVWLERGGGASIAPWGFGGPELLTASIRRLVAAAGLDAELGGTIALPDGTTLHVAGLGAGLAAPLLGAYRPAMATWALSTLRSRGTIGPTACLAITAALRSGAGVLVYGTRPVATHALADAIASEFQDDRVVVCSDAPPRTRAGHLQRGAGAMAHAMALGVDLAIANPLDADGVAELVATSSTWAPALVATVGGASPASALQRLAASAAASHGIPIDAVRAWLAANLPLLVQVTMIDGTPTVTRVHDQDTDGTLRPLAVMRTSGRTREHYRMGPAPGVSAFVDATVASGRLPRTEVPDLTVATGGWVPDRDPT